MPDDNGKPTFDQLRDALMPPGTDREALWAALKAAHRTGGYVPGRQAPDISGSVPPELVGMLRAGAAQAHYACSICGNAHDRRVTCADPSISMTGRTAGPPPDPFTKGSEAAAGLAEMYEDMVASGIPLSSVERILGAMLATYGAMTKDEP